MVELIKKIETEQKFAEAMYRDFRSKRYGIAQCCYSDLQKARIQKELCDWQEKTPPQNCTPTSTHCPSVTVCPDNSVLEDMQRQLEQLKREISNITTDSFVFEQPTPATEWYIVHNLGKYPNLNVEDLLGDDIVGEVTYINLNELKITFIIPVAGTAYLS